MNLSVSSQLMGAGMYKSIMLSTEKSSKKLSSGYRINSAADDAAGLSISEGMRQKIRGLNQGTRNALDGVSWVQTADGALNEIHSLLQRMNELSVQSSNDTNTASDRAAIEKEFKQLQLEVDRISTTTQFNTKDVFNPHEDTYTQLEGAKKWELNEYHTVYPGFNTLTLKTRETIYDPADPTVRTTPQASTVEIPVGVYTTQELVDALDTAMEQAGLLDQGINLEITDDGYININYENGEEVTAVQGPLSYLINDSYVGGILGCIFGTTEFEEDDSALAIVSGINDTMTFTMQKYDGTESEETITIPEGEYTRDDLINILKPLLVQTSLQPVPFEKGIQIVSDDTILTGLRGNMFKIDTIQPVFTSVFYDNIQYGSVELEPAEFTGGSVLTLGSTNSDNEHFIIDGSNNKLTLSANGGSPITLTIPAGTYDIDSMVNQLNKLFQQENLDLSCSKYSGTNKTVGLKISSGVEGEMSSINFDTSSSAYHTLFTHYEFYEEEKDAILSNPSGGQSTATWIAHKDLSSGLAVTPDNNKFTLSVSLIGGSKYSKEITLPSGYQSQTDLIQSIQTQIDSDAKLAGKIAVGTDNNCLCFNSIEGSKIQSFSLSEIEGNNGLRDIASSFEPLYPTLEEKGELALNKPMAFPITFDDSNYQMTIKIDDVDRSIAFDKNRPLSSSEILATINQEIAAYDTPITFTDVTGNGATNELSETAASKTTNYSRSYYANGETVAIEGAVGRYSTNTPAAFTVNAPLPDQLTIDGSNNTISITANGVNKTITLDNGTYTAGSLVQSIRQKFGGFVDVSYGASGLTFSSKLDSTHKIGAKTTISSSTGSSSFFKYIENTRSTGSSQSDSPLRSTINFDATNKTFRLDTVVNGTPGTLSVTFEEKEYTREELVEELNNKLKLNSIPATASLNDSGNLIISTTVPGNGTEVSYKVDSSNNDLFGKAVFSKYSTPAVATIGKPIADSIIIDSTSNELKLTLNGTEETITLSAGTYDREGFVEMLNNALVTQNLPVEAMLRGAQLSFATTNTGKEQSIALSYAKGGSAMPQIMGVEHTNGATASFAATGELILTGDNDQVAFELDTNNASVFYQPETGYTKPCASSIEASSAYAHLLSGNIIEYPITINSDNNDLSFRFTENGNNHDISIALTQKQYTTQDSLIKELQTKLNQQPGLDGKLLVKNESGKICIQSVNSGAKYSLSNFSGDFYEKLLNTTTYINEEHEVKNIAGSQKLTPAFAVGRVDVNSIPQNIRKGENDNLKIDFTIDGNTTTLDLKLNVGSYSGQALAGMIQGKLDEALIAKGFEPNTIRAQVGGVKTGVAGALDNNSLVFMMTGAHSYTVEGSEKYVIDNISGTAANSFFYSTDGSIMVAYNRGNVDISEGVTLEADETEFHFAYNGNSYDITLQPGDYTPTELATALNNEISKIESNIPNLKSSVTAKVNDGVLGLYASDYSRSPIDDITGTARKKIFLRENGVVGEDDDLHLQLSDTTEDSILLDRPAVDTASLRINTLTLSNFIGAQKAITRVNKAIERISNTRIYFGSLQNRLEHAINGNNNNAENTQAAESRLRDADMASENLEYAKNTILLQASQAMMSQKMKNAQAVLSLLQ